MTDDDDYERVEEYLDDNDNDIFMQYGASYSNLTDTKKEQVFIDKFFKGLDAYAPSAQDLRIGFDDYLKTGGSGTGNEVITMHRRGKDYRVIRSVSTGKIIRWIK
jgi:hypothetical protein